MQTYYYVRRSQCEQRLARSSDQFNTVPLLMSNFDRDNENHHEHSLPGLNIVMSVHISNQSKSGSVLTRNANHLVIQYKRISIVHSDATDPMMIVSRDLLLRMAVKTPFTDGNLLPMVFIFPEMSPNVDR